MKLKDYQPPEFLIPRIDLEFLLHSHELATIRSRMEVVSNGSSSFLELRGEGQTLNYVKVNGRQLSKKEYTLTKETLRFASPGEKFTVEIESEINPSKNEELSGLYKSGDILCTQCESQGFRRITYHLDRPDVMGVYTTRIEANKKEFPILLANGNLKEEGNLPAGRHYTVWQDPFPKPSYLFALVAGDLGEVKGSFKTKSGRIIDLRFYVDKGNEKQAAHAMESLKKAMKWDEETFGLECDLDRYMVVAVNSFNFGAMENKGLNVFNAKYVLADPSTATDSDFEDILGVIGHEYFHNWTGNRITLRDWFQLTLKEGLTVYRDRRFTADHTSEVVKRINDVRDVRNHQFPEDSGPNAHPIQPQEVKEIENFYTSTVYEKGAEVIRMIETLIGKEGFRRGMDKYVEMFDGKAVTRDDFVRAMELGSGKDLTQFRKWYTQIGTPECKVSGKYVKGKYSLTTEQSNKRKGKEQGPLHIPFAVGLLGKDGRELDSRVLEVTKLKQTFDFDIPEKPIPSLLRSFSAPIKVEYDYSDDELAFLLSYDTDKFNRWDAGQRLMTKELQSYVQMFQKGKVPKVNGALLTAVGKLLKVNDPAFVAETLVLPSVASLVEEMNVCDYESAVNARKTLRKEIALAHETAFKKLYENFNDSHPYSNDQVSIGKRSLKNIALGYLFSTEKERYVSLVHKQFTDADNMTDKQAALGLLANRENPFREKALKQFYSQWKSNPLVMDKWLGVQSSADIPDILSAVRALEKNPVYDSKNPNRIRALVGGFIGNHLHFHHASGSGYEYVASKILEIDKFNSSLAAGLAKSFHKFSKMDAGRKKLMKTQLERIMKANPSKKLLEIVGNTLKS